MIIDASDFGLKTLKRGRFLWVRYEKKQLRQADAVCIVWEFNFCGLTWHVTKRKPAARWRCRACKRDVDLKAAKPCGCDTSPSPWEIVP